MDTYLVTIALIFVVMLLGIGIDRLYRAFAARHPDLGPFRKPEGGCGSCGGGCDNGACDTSDKSAVATPAEKEMR